MRTNRSQKATLCNKVPYVLAYTPTIKNCPKMRNFVKPAYKATPKIPWCVVWANKKRVSICNALMKIHYNQSICLGNNITGKLIMKKYLKNLIFEVQLKLIVKLSCSLSELTLYGAVSILWLYV